LIFLDVNGILSTTKFTIVVNKSKEKSMVGLIIYLALGYWAVGETIYKNKIFINPGSIMFNRGQSQCGSYAIVSVDDKLHVDFFDSRTQKKIPQSLIDKDQDILNEFKRFACQK
jgi:hypothetical protein